MKLPNEIINRRKEMAKTKEELILESFRYTAQECAEEIRTIITDGSNALQLSQNKKNWLWWNKFILYLYSNQVTKERFQKLLDNGNYIVRYWEKIKEIVQDIRNIEDFEEYPEVANWFNVWSNSLVGENIFFRVGNGNIEEGKKHAKKLFLKFQLEEWNKTIPEKREDQPSQAYYKHKFTEEQVRQMRHLLPEGYPGFFIFVEMVSNDKIRHHIYYDNRFIMPEQYTDQNIIPFVIQEIYQKINQGMIQV